MLRLLRTLVLLAAALPCSARAEELARLLPPDLVPGLEFGRVLAQEAGLLVVGCPRDDALGYDVGCVHVFGPEGGGFSHQQRIDPPTALEGAGFGQSLDVDAARIAVGSLPTASGSSNGVAVYERSGATWVLTAALSPPGALVGTNFGQQVALDGDVLLASAPSDDTVATGGGAVHVWRNVGGTWVYDQKILPPVVQSYSWLGGALALDAGTAVIGKRDGSAHGLLHVFVDSGTSFMHDATLRPDVPSYWDRFGSAVDVEDGTIVVGASGRDAGAPNAGAALVFERVGGAWTERALLAAPGAHADAHLGTACAIGGDRVLVGAPQTHPDGVAHLYERAGGSWVHSEAVIPCSLEGGARAGSAVSIAWPLVGVGAPGAAAGVGAAWVFDLDGRPANDCGAGRTWHVDAAGVPPGSGTPEDPYPSIGGALAQPGTRDGDTLLVAPGVYPGGFVTTKAVRIVGRDGPDATVVDVRGAGEVALDGPSRGATVLQGVTVLGPAVTGRCVRLDQGWLDRVVVLGAGTGTGVFAQAGSALVTCSVIARHSTGADVSHPVWGDGQLECWNSIFWHNAEDVVSHFDESSALFFHSRLESSGFLVTLVATINDDPELVDVASGDVHLRAASPCIDGANPEAPPDPDGSPADMGAFPFDPGYVPEPHAYCVGTPNSAGAGARISWAGSTSVAANDFTLLVSGSVPGEFGLFYYGPALVEFPFGDGFRCVGGGATGTSRLNPAEVSDGAGAATRWLDFTVPPASAGPGAIHAGDARSFQYWYRDPLGPGGTGFNLSDALRAVFVP